MPPPVDVAWTLSPSAPVVGPAILTITLRGPAGDAVRRRDGASRGSHVASRDGAGRGATRDERAPGVYDVPFAFTMPGDWVLLVSVALPEGGRVERRIEVANVRPSG